MTTFTIVNKANKLFDGHYSDKADALEVLNNYFKIHYSSLNWELVQNDIQTSYTGWVKHNSDLGFKIFCTILPEEQLLSNVFLQPKFESLQTQVLDLFERQRSLSCLDFPEDCIL